MGFWNHFWFWASIVVLCALMAICVGVVVWGLTYDPHRADWIEYCQRQSPTWDCHARYRGR
jgi:hypothetical protein